MNILIRSASQLVNPLARQRMMGYGTAAGGGVSIPALPAGATGRWDASALSGNDGDLIATFGDIIGSNNGTAAGSARGTLKTGANGQNGKNVLQFDGVANSYTLASFSDAGSNTFTIATVAKRTGSDMVYIGSGAFLPATGRSATSFLAGDQTSYSEAANVNTGWEIVILGRASLTSFGMRNGVALTFGSNSSFATAAKLDRIGSRQTVYGNGDIADLIYWPTQLSSQERADACANLNAKWGVY